MNRRDLADLMVTVVSDIYGAISSDGHAPGAIETGAGADTVGCARHTRLAGKRLHHTRWRDLAQQVVARVGHEKVAVLVQRYPLRAGKGSDAASAIGCAHLA